jgi:hypothetical protein
MQEKKEFLSRRIILFSGILILAIIVIIGFFIIRKKSTSTSNSINAIPQDASLVIQINKFQNIQNSLFNGNRIWGSLKSLDPINKLDSSLQYLDSLAGKYSDLSALLYKSRIYISGHFIGGRKTDFLFIIEQLPGINNRQIPDLLEKIFLQELKRTERKYEGKSIYTVEVNKNSKKINYFFALIEGNVLISKSVILIENAIRQSSLPNSLMNDKGFAHVISTAGQSKDANLFIDMHRFTGILSCLANPDFSQKLRGYKYFTGWMESLI